MIGIYILVALVIGLIAVVFGVSVASYNPSMVLQTLANPAILTLAGIIAIVVLAVLIYLNVLLQIAILKVVFEANKSMSVFQTIKDSRPLVWPLLAVNLLAGALTLGGFMLLIIPGIVLALLLSFAQYEVIFNHKRGVEALRRSFALFATDFWGIFGRILLFAVISIIITILCSSIAGKGAGSLLSWIISTLVGWFGLAYSLTIYKELLGAHPNLPGKNIKGLVITSLVGWAILMLFVFAGMNLVLRYKDTIFGSILNDYERSQQKDYLSPPGLPMYDTDDAPMMYEEDESTPPDAESI